jgi:hypothetical protein
LPVITPVSGLRRSPATISRELCRNAHPDSGDYRPWAAQRRSALRRARPKIGKIASNEELLVLWRKDCVTGGVLSRSVADSSINTPADRRCT